MSRLRNRIRKADFFSDGELLRWPRDKRTTYSGLWALAEDSGCLEDDPLTWKVLLWPSPLDDDITVDLLTQWRDEMVADGKLIPYEADGKRCLFIRSFHKHESPRNPQQPDLPLPPWVVCERPEGVSVDGKRWKRCSYRVVEESIPTESSVCTDSVQTPYRHSADSVLDPLSCPVLSCSVNPPYPPLPVENSETSAESEEQGWSNDHEDQKHPVSHAATSCDGEPCPVRELPQEAVPALRAAILASDHPDLWEQYGRGGQFDANLATHAKRVCAAAMKALAEFPRPQREALCAKAQVWAIESLKGSKDVQAVVRARCRSRPPLGDLIGDRRLETLRRSQLRRDRKGEPKPLAELLAKGTS